MRPCTVYSPNDIVSAKEYPAREKREFTVPPISNIQLHHRLMRASHLLRHGHGEPELKVAPGQRRVLTNLFENNGALPQQTLLELLGIAPATLSEALGKLESRGMIVREKSDKDKRAVIVRLTETGSKQAENILSVDKAVAAEVFAPLDADERRALAGALQKILDAWNANN